MTVYIYIYIYIYIYMCVGGVFVNNGIYIMTVYIYIYIIIIEIYIYIYEVIEMKMRLRNVIERWKAHRGKIPSVLSLDYNDCISFRGISPTLKKGVPRRVTRNWRWCWESSSVSCGFPFPGVLFVSILSGNNIIIIISSNSASLDQIIWFGLVWFGFMAYHPS